MKYKNKKTVFNGRKYDSQKEALRACQLEQLLKDGDISLLEYQVPHPLFVNGKLVCTYKADFTYYLNGKLIVEDVKGYKTAIYQLKKKLLKACLGIDILET